MLIQILFITDRAVGTLNVVMGVLVFLNFASLDSGLTLGMPLAFYTSVPVTRTTNFYPSAKSSKLPL